MSCFHPSASTIVDERDDEDETQLVDQRGAAVEDMPETPPKRRKMGNKYEAFESEEQEQLKNYEKLESKARKVLNMTHANLFTALSRGQMPDGIKYLKERMDTLKKKTSLDPICIGFLGRTGAGKSSLLNAMIGKRLFLPVSGNRACTSCIVQVKRSKNDYCEATIHLLSEEEWKDELKNLVEVLRKTGDDYEDDNSDESVSEAIDKLRALYGAGAENKSYNDLLKAKPKVTIPARRVIQLKEKEAEGFSKALDPYIRVGDGDSKALCLWPLIKNVEVTIPGSDILPEGITFVDIPGTGDFNSKRDEMWEKSIDTCSVLWIISDIERVLGEKVQGSLLDAGIKAYIGGICVDMAMVVTKSDKLDLEEYKRERGNKNVPIKNKHDAILERNEDVKRKKERSMKEKLKRRLPPDSELLLKSHLVYTVSATEFWEAAHLSPEETEIPELRKNIRRIYLNEKKKLVTDYVIEVLGLLLLAENLGSEEHLLEQHFQESGVEEFMKKEIDTLGRNLERCFSEIEQPLCDGVKHARTNYKKIVDRMLMRDDGYKGFHRTLKAVCLKNGVYASKVFARIDFNENLARPLYEKIEGTFGGIFRIQRITRTSLWAQLENFQTAVQEKIRQIGRDNKLPNDHTKIKTCIHEIDVILMKLRQKILTKKTGIYQTLPIAIQDVLKPHYQEASRVSGFQSCQKMQGILRENIEKEVAKKMFEKAKSKMMSYFLELKGEIMATLEKETSVVLKLILLQHEQLAVRLPDIENECREIKRLHSMLQTID